MTEPKVWRVRLAAAALADFRNILVWTSENFGAKQARIYSATLSIALTELTTRGRIKSGATLRDEIGKGIFALHVARHRRKGRHFVVFRMRRDINGELIDVLRLLHNAMDLPRHIQSGSGAN